jgi:hypothetical protein
MSENKRFTAMVCESTASYTVPKTSFKRIEYKSQFKSAINDPPKNLFLLTSLTRLPEITSLIKSAVQTHRLRAILLRQDVDGRWIPQMLERASVHVLKNVLVFSDAIVPQRIMNAWSMGYAGNLIADATIVNENLLVVSCELERFEVAFDAIPGLKKLPVKKRHAFTISPEGSYIHWPEPDIHIDMDGIRYLTDPTWRQKCDIEKIAHEKTFGASIAAIRKNYSLRQSDIIGLSDRQIRRIEAGERPSLQTLQLLAKAHKMEVNDYLNEIAKQIKRG